MYGSSRLGIWSRNVNMDVLPTGGGTVALLGSAGIDTFNRGNKFFELSNHLGNVLVTVSDRKFGQSPVNNLYTSFTADVVSATDYAPFGMQMVGRTFSAGAYRYGFNGKEKDPETSGEGNQYDYGFRIYNPRLGKFLSVDPLTKEYPWNSTYAFAENDVVRSIDLDGLEKKTVIHWVDKQHNDGQLKITRSRVIVENVTQVGNGTTQTDGVQAGVVYATTEVYYYFFNENKIYKGGTVIESLSDLKAPKPSAAYDYTSKSSMLQKEKDDARYAPYAGSIFNPANWGAYGKLTRRDLNAPDNAMTIEDVSMGMLAFTSVVGAPATVRAMLKAEGVAVEGVNGAAMEPRLGSFDGPGGMARLKYQKAPYHGTENGILKSKAPTDGQGALDVSLQIKETSPRRIGVDYSTNEFVVFDKTLDNTYHGHVRTWNQLHQDMKNTLIKNGMADSKGKILTGTQ
jgi:RHS repeat-associated protein